MSSSNRSIAVQPTEIGPFLVLAKRRGTVGQYYGVVAKSEDGGRRNAVHTTRRFSGKGAKARAFQAATLWAQAESTKADACLHDQSKPLPEAENNVDLD